jgi:hypothetical protein
MTGTYWCILFYDRRYFTWLRNRRKAVNHSAYSVDLHDPNTLLAAFAHAVRRDGGDQDDIGHYAKGETKTDTAHPAARLIIEWTAQL